MAPLALSVFIFVRACASRPLSSRTTLSASPPTYKADGVAVWLKNWAEQFGQAMPNSSDVCLYAASKKVCLSPIS